MEMYLLAGFQRGEVLWQKGNDAFIPPDAASVVCLNNKLGTKLQQMFV